jgi:hypothetical protein
MTTRALGSSPPVSYSIRWRLLAAVLLAGSFLAGLKIGFWMLIFALYLSVLILALGKPLRQLIKLVYRGFAPAGLIAIFLGFVLDIGLAAPIPNDPTRTTLALVAGILVGLLLVNVAIDWYSWARLRWILNLSPDVDPKTGRRVLRQLFLGINHPVLMVKDGAYETTKDGGATGVLQKIGGPGLMFVHHGNAVVLENAGKFTRVARGGVTMLKLYERPRAVVDLRRKQEPVRVEDVYTRDGVSLRADIILWYQMRRRPPGATPPPTSPAAGPCLPRPTLRRRAFTGIGDLFYALAGHTPPSAIALAGGPEEVPGDTIGERDAVEMAVDAAAHTPPVQPIDQYDVSEENIINAVYLTDDWQRGVRTMTGNILRDIVGERTLDSLFEYNKAEGGLLPRNEIRESLMRRLNWFLDYERWGVEIIWCDIATVALPDSARKRMLEKWEAEWEARIAGAQKLATISRGEADATAASAQEAARARASMQMMAALRDAVQDKENPTSSDDLDRIIRLRLIDAVEKMAGEHVNGMFLPASLLDALGAREVLAGGARPKPTTSADPDGRE